MIKAVLFDLDNTLYDYDAAHAAAFRELTAYAVRTFGLTAAEFDSLHRHADQLLKERVGSVTAAVHNRLLRYQVILEELGQHVRYAPRMAEIYWSAFLDAMEPGPGLYTCFAWLKDHGYTVGIGTNMTADYQYAKLQKLDILDTIDFLVTSEEVGTEKPDCRLFGCCVKKAGCSADECVFVGDSLDSDARGALAAGMVPVWLCPPDQDSPASIRRIASLTELPGLLQSL